MINFEILNGIGCPQTRKYIQSQNADAGIYNMNSGTFYFTLLYLHINIILSKWESLNIKSRVELSIVKHVNFLERSKYPATEFPHSLVLYYQIKIPNLIL